MATHKKQVPKNINNKDFRFIREFNKITMTGICKELGISRSYVMQGYGSNETYQKIKESIEKKFANIYLNIIRDEQ